MAYIIMYYCVYYALAGIQDLKFKGYRYINKIQNGTSHAYYNNYIDSNTMIDDNDAGTNGVGKCNG